MLKNPRRARLAALVFIAALTLAAAPATAGASPFTPLELQLAQEIISTPQTAETNTVHTEKAVRRGIVRIQPAPKPAPKPAAKPTSRTQPKTHRPRATPSYYIHSADPVSVRAKGCRAGSHRAFGIVILAFGKPYYNGHSYGTLTFSGWFASNNEITLAMEAFARGYVACLPKGSRAHIVLARGTSNYYGWVPSNFQAGRRWARETVVFARYLRATGLDSRVTSAAATDAEPAWNPSFTRTRDFFRGYRAYGPGHLLYNYGSLDGGVGAIWNARQVFYVSGGMKYARIIPQIYYPSMAEQWATMSRIAAERFGRPLHFAGLMTQHKAECGCGYEPKEAHQALVRELRKEPTTWVRQLPAVTNILWS